MTPIKLWVQGIPKAQPRPRAFAFRGSARVYNPGTAEAWKSAIAIAAKPFVPKQPFTGPIRVDTDFMFLRPKSHYRTGTYAGVLKDNAPYFHTQKPDRDNLDKAILDALTTLRFWRNDAQVCVGEIRKFYGLVEPGALIVISSAEHFPDTQCAPSCSASCCP